MLSLARIAERAVRPRERLTVSQWADKFRYLSPVASAEPGRWRTDRAAYQRGIMDAFTEPGVKAIRIMSSAQVGKTEVINNAVGYFADWDPCPIMVVHPTLEMGETWSNVKFTPAMEATPRLKRIFSHGNKRDPNNKVREKKFPGGVLVVSGSNSPASLAQRSIRIVLKDDRDRFAYSAGLEGDPGDLAVKRTQTFWNSLDADFSTPTETGFSPIEKDFLASDQRRYYVACPECGHPQTLKWSQVHWEKEELDDGGHKHHPETAAYACEACGSLWNDADRWWAVRYADKLHLCGCNGYGWVAHAPFDGVAGFHLNELYSSWSTLEEMVRGFFKAKGDPAKMKVWVNTTLGESFEDSGETVVANEIQARAEDYGPDLISALVALITAGVDVQGDRWEITIIGWGRGEESWVLDHHILHGDPADPAAWPKALDPVLSQRFTTEDGRELTIQAVGVDTGHQADEAYKYCAKRWRKNIWALKGGGVKDVPIWPVRYTKARHGARLFVINPDAGKDTFHGRLRGIRRKGPGYCHFPRHLDAEYFKQLAAEKKVVRADKFRRPQKTWVQTRDRNEALDCWVYAFAALKGYLINRRRDLDKMAARLDKKPRTAPKTIKRMDSAPPSGGVSNSTGVGGLAPIRSHDPYV